MRIAHVLTYVSASGSYGGPVAVAIAQCRALAARGHHVTLLAGWDGAAELSIPGVDVHLHRARRLPGIGFAGLVAPSLWWDLRRLRRDLDVVHFHLARDLVQLPAAAMTVRHVRSHMQPHGMIRPDTRIAARALDRLLTRPTLRQASSLLILTNSEAVDVACLSPASRIIRIRNGVDLPPDRARWSDVPTVLFLARLQSRKRPVEFVRMAAHVVAVRPNTVFQIVGADEGEGGAVLREIRRLGLQEVVTYMGPLPQSEVSAVMSAAQVYVLPSVDEPFPMSVLEAMAHGLPTVITTETGISDELQRRSSARVTDPQAQSLADAVVELLDQQIWASQSRAARSDIEQFFSVDSVADTLENAYQW